MRRKKNDFPTLDEIHFTKTDIEDAIDEFSNTAASGPDGQAAILLKKCKAVLSGTFSQLWWDCIDQRIIPESLKEAHIIPIHEGGHQGLAIGSHVTHHQSVREGD